MEDTGRRIYLTMRWKNECIVNCDVNDDGLECYDRIIENNEDGDDDAF